MDRINKLYYGDNLDILKTIPDESVDLIYLDPPFNSNRNYNVLFENKSGEKSRAQIQAFTDTWKWDIESESAFQNSVTKNPGKIAQTLQGFRMMLGSSDMMAYLIMMTPRLIELKRVLKTTGSIYLHCDPTASHYIKIILDAIFGTNNFLNEIIWSYNVGGKSKKYFARKHDVIFFYSKTSDYYFDGLKVGTPRQTGSLSFGGRIGEDVNGRPYQDKIAKGGKIYRYFLDEGKIPEDVWSIQTLQSQSKERLGYPTQKPEELLERMIKASCPSNGVVLDPFCGCGTTIAVAQKLGRQWIGIDITQLAISLIRYRLKLVNTPENSYQVFGEPVCLDEARQLALENRYQFQFWALGLIGARPEEEKKGADKGIDGMLYFYDEKTPQAKKIIIQVKSGHIGSSHIRDLRGVLDRENAQIGVYITLEEPTKNMTKEAAEAGFYKSPFMWNNQNQFPKIQILTIADLFEGKSILYPKSTNITL